ncbi:MAG: outer membrane lipoprotein chaperone LolA, partial [Nitrospinales bacterium]
MKPIPQKTVLKKLSTLGILVGIACLPLSSGAGEGRVTLEAIQKRFDHVKTFKAKFTQKAYVKILNQTQKSEGVVYIKKPGKMKWTYRNPEPQVLISNNKTLWLYLPEDKQATKTSIKDIYTSNTPALFLSGKGKLAESFKLIKITPGPPLAVVLIPKQKDQGIDRLVLMIDNKNYQIIGSQVYDKLGNRTDILF